MSGFGVSCATATSERGKLSSRSWVVDQELHSAGIPDFLREYPVVRALRLTIHFLTNDTLPPNMIELLAGNSLARRHISACLNTGEIAFRPVAMSGIVTLLPDLSRQAQLPLLLSSLDLTEVNWTMSKPPQSAKPVGILSALRRRFRIHVRDLLSKNWGARIAISQITKEDLIKRDLSGARSW